MTILRDRSIIMQANWAGSSCFMWIHTESISPKENLHVWGFTLGGVLCLCLSRWNKALRRCVWAVEIWHFGVLAFRQKPRYSAYQLTTQTAEYGNCAPKIFFE